MALAEAVIARSKDISMGSQQDLNSSGAIHFAAKELIMVKLAFGRFETKSDTGIIVHVFVVENNARVFSHYKTILEGGQTDMALHGTQYGYGKPTVL